MRDKPGGTAPSPIPPLGPVLEFMRLIWALDHGLQSTSKRMRGRLGVTGPQRLVIRIVGRVPGIAAGHLAEVLHVHPSTLTGVLTRLESAGLLKRRSDPEDGRRSLLYLTPRGQQVDKGTRGTVESAVRSALVRLSPAKLSAAREALLAITRNLSNSEVRRERTRAARRLPHPP
jgi:DNA-binding MarR family transcriptional regulator